MHKQLLSGLLLHGMKHSSSWVEGPSKVFLAHSSYLQPIMGPNSSGMLSQHDIMRVRLQAGTKSGGAATTAPGAENVNPEQNERPTKKRKGKAKKGTEEAEATGKHSRVG